MNKDLLLSAIPLPELVDGIAKAVRDEIAAQPAANPPQPEELLSRKDTAELLRITLPTLREYTRRGLVKGYRIGARVRYRRSEVLAALAPIATRKTTRP